MIDYNQIEKRWQEQWEYARVFEPEINEKESLLVTAAIPYVNAPPHIGHFRTYSTADTYARYMRMKGFNVLYPFGFHATGTPVLAFAKRLANKDKELIDELRMFHVADEDIAQMTDPVYISKYFIKRQEEDFRKAGLGIDWRRKFITTEPLFSKLIEWQFKKLKDMGYLVKGKHPVGWCPTDNQAVGQHDTKHDVHPKIEELVAIKFKDSAADVFFPCATYRPETVYGVTNLFIKDGSPYVIAKIEGISYYLSKEAAEALKYQFAIQVEGEIAPQELLKKKAVNPITKEEVSVLPGFFVKADFGTGVVMSVPAHAPFDYVALERLKASGYPLPKMEMEYKKIIDIKEADAAKDPQNPQRAIPSLGYLEALKAKPDANDDILEVATKNIYKEESRKGVMLVGKYQGKSEPEARDGLKADMLASKDALSVMIIANAEPVYCRDGTKVVVNLLTEQWFINYGDKAWKAKASETLAKMKIRPDKYVKSFEGAIEWIDLRPTERAQGLGTKFPFNPEHIIESLSDSTIYMVFYTFDYILRAANVVPEQLVPAFFDYVLLFQDELNHVSQLTRIDPLTLKKCRESFEYWYKNTSRHSAFEHIYNHFTMYIFNHAALFPEEFQPKQIVVNGMLNYEGEKMSKSLGNVVPLVDGVQKYGSDPMRFIEVAGADLDTETNFSLDGIRSLIAKNETLLGFIDAINRMGGTELQHIDYWLYSKLNSKIAKVTESMDRLEFRAAYTEAYYNSITEMEWYIARGGQNQFAGRDFLQAVVLMLGPIMPHLTEELWHRMGNKSLAAQEHWPSVDGGMINKNIEATEAIIAGTITDITSVVELTSKIDANKGKGLKEIHIIVADDWKRLAFNMLVESKEMQKVIGDPSLAEVGKEKLARFLSQYAKKGAALAKLPDISSDAMKAGISGASEYIAKKFKAPLIVETESSSSSKRAERAFPNKPSIDVTWG